MTRHKVRTAEKLQSLMRLLLATYYYEVLLCGYTSEVNETPQLAPSISAGICTESSITAAVGARAKSKAGTHVALPYPSLTFGHSWLLERSLGEPMFNYSTTYRLTDTLDLFSHVLILVMSTKPSVLLPRLLECTKCC